MTKDKSMTQPTPTVATATLNPNGDVGHQLVSTFSRYLSSTKWFQEFQQRATEMKSKLDSVFKDMKTVDEELKTCEEIIVTQKALISKINERKPVLQREIVSVRKQLKDQTDKLECASNYVDYLTQILKHKTSQSCDVQMIVTQTESAVRITFNSLRKYFENVENIIQEIEAESKINPENGLREKLLYILDLPNQLNPKQEDVLEATGFLKNFLMHSAKFIKVALLLERKRDQNASYEHGSLLKVLREPLASSNIEVEPDKNVPSESLMDTTSDEEDPRRENSPFRRVSQIKRTLKDAGITPGSRSDGKQKKLDG